MSIRLKPVNLMTAEELSHLLESMKQFSELYHWHDEEGAGYRQQAGDT